jgi:hypothetical protein
MKLKKFDWSDLKQPTRIYLILGVLLAVLLILTPFPKMFLNHLGKMFSTTAEKLAAVDWIGIPRASETSDEEEEASAVPAPQDPASTKGKWSARSSRSNGSNGSSFQKSPPPKKSPYGDRIVYPIPQRVTLSHIEGNNFTNCFATNFTKLQLLLAGEYIPGRFLPQIDLRGDRFDDTTYAASGGLVLRYVPKKNGPVNRMYGINAYYDYRQGNVGYFNQFGGGIEILGKRWDFRANVYVPVGGKRKMQECVFDYDGGFQAIKDEFESISFAYNLEVGWLAINSQYLLLYLAGGPYYIAGRTCFDKTRGGEFRIQPQYKDYIALNAIFSYDPLFHAVYQFEVILHLPLYKLSKKIDKKATCGLNARQIYQPVIRYDVMPIGRCTCWMFNWDDMLP